MLQRLEIPYKIYDHPPIFTVAEGEHLKASIPGTHCRNLFLCDKKKTMALLTLANETKLDLKKLDSLIGMGRVSFGSADRLWRFLGIYPGAVCPFAAINDKNHDVRILLDRAMMDGDLINVHPLDNARTVSIAPNDLLKFFTHTGHQPEIIDLSAAAPWFF